jgi:hypothetical protein
MIVVGCTSAGGASTSASGFSSSIIFRISDASRWQQGRANLHYINLYHEVE